VNVDTICYLSLRGPQELVCDVLKQKTLRMKSCNSLFSKS